MSCSSCSGFRQIRSEGTTQHDADRVAAKRQYRARLYRRNAVVAGRHRRVGVADDRDAETNLVAGGCGQVLRGSCRLHDRRRLAADRQGVQSHVGPAWAGQRGEPVRHPHRGQRTGRPADRFGRKPMFIIEMALFVLFLVAIVLAQSFVWLIVCLFGMGLALGCDYPTAHLVISESTPTRSRGTLVLSAFGFQAAGALVGTAVGYLVLREDPNLLAWRWMYATAIIPAALVLLGRFFVTESPHWLAIQDRERDAEREILRLLQRKPPYPSDVSLSDSDGQDDGSAGYGALFRGRNLRATILASVPWFLQDLATYGIGIFTPTILAASVGHKREHAQNVVDLVANDMIAAKGAAFIDILLLIGIVGAVLLSDRVGRMRLQIFGFIGCALGLFISAQSVHYDGGTKMMLIFAGFMLFNFMTNLGPNSQTYLIAGEVFPTAIRGIGAGFAASFAKIGACMTTFLFPILLADIGTAELLYVLVGASLLGALVTWLFRIETAGVSLEHIGVDTGKDALADSGKMLEGQSIHSEAIAH